MRQRFLTTLAGMLMLCSAAAAQDFLPLEPGNYWTYRATDGQETFSISVGMSQVFTGGQVYHSLRGYAAAPMLVRRTAEGDIVWLDEETGQEHLLTRFTGASSPYSTVISGCEQMANAGDRRVPYTGPAIRSSAALEIVYQTPGCADHGFELEHYLENIGLVRRVVTTIAGPRTFSLVAARVGRMTLTANPSAVARLVLDQARFAWGSNSSEPLRIGASLWISLLDTGSVRMRFASSQRYELVVRDDRGEVVYQWSDGMMFLPVIQEEETIVGERTFRVEADWMPGSIPGGEQHYQVEMWLTTSDGPQFAASAGITLCGDVCVFNSN